MAILNGWWAVFAAIVLTVFVVSIVLGITLYAAALVLALVIGAPILGLLVAVFLPLPVFVRVVIALSVSILALVYGLQHLEVI